MLLGYSITRTVPPRLLGGRFLRNLALQGGATQHAQHSTAQHDNRRQSAMNRQGSKRGQVSVLETTERMGRAERHTWFRTYKKTQLHLAHCMSRHPSTTDLIQSPLAPSLPDPVSHHPPTAPLSDPTEEQQKPLKHTGKLRSSALLLDRLLFQC